ncbi:5099_t:CDS:1, partial [Racocetra fulgida]
PKDSIYCNVYCSPVFEKGDLFPKGHLKLGNHADVNKLATR